MDINTTEYELLKYQFPDGIPSDRIEELDRHIKTYIEISEYTNFLAGYLYPTNDLKMKI